MTGSPGGLAPEMNADPKFKFSVSPTARGRSALSSVTWELSHVSEADRNEAFKALSRLSCTIVRVGVSNVNKSCRAVFCDLDRNAT